MSLKYCVYIWICLSTVDGQQGRERRPMVGLPQGYVTGVKIYTESGRLADAFFGIPYATPPIGNLRFQPPQKHQGWNDTYEALNYKPPCPQLPLVEGTSYSEDCLYLNIWSPETSPRTSPMPVVVFIEGIDFSKRNPIPVSGQDLAMEGLIVVTLNYRMNVFGFFCLGIREARGNLGLLDQYFAMLWVRENIRYFGGDPDKITLFGHSAGAASVVLHMVSPRTGGMFNRLIVSSGSALSPWNLAPYNETVAASTKILKILGCFYPHSISSLKCIFAKTTEDILKAYEEYSGIGNAFDMFLPIVDSFLLENDSYLPVDPDDILHNEYPQVPILTGIGKPISDPHYRQWSELASQSFSQLQQYMEQSKIPEIIKRYRFNLDREEEITELIKWKYDISRQDDERALLKKLKKLDYDVRIQVPYHLQLNQLQTTYLQSIYAYYIDTLGIDMNLNNTFMTADLLMLFGPILLNQLGRRRFNNNEWQISKQLKQFWTNFIIFGNPTPGNTRQNWQRYMPNRYYVENISIENVEEEDNCKQVSFWAQLLPKISHIETPVPNNNIIELQRSLDPTSGYRHALYTLIALVIALLALLLICIALLKRRSKERERHLHMTY